MYPLSLVIATASLLLAADAPRDDAVRAEKAKFQGTWKLVSVEINGQQLAMDKLGESRLTIKGDSYSFQWEDIRLEMTFAVDPGKKPKTMDMTIVEGKDRGKVFHAIYELDGNNLRICRMSDPDRDRPTEFGTRPNSGLMLVIWEREKP